MLIENVSRVLLDCDFDLIAIDLIGHLALISNDYELRHDVAILIQHVNQRVLEFVNVLDFCCFVLASVNSSWNVFDSSNDCDFVNGYEIYCMKCKEMEKKMGRNEK